MAQVVIAVGVSSALMFFLFFVIPAMGGTTKPTKDR